jgi:hypothetical protein
MGSLVRPGRSGVLETVKRFVDVSRHGPIDYAVHVVPLQCQAKVQLAGPVDGNFVHFLEGVNEMLGVGGAGVLDTKIVDNECKYSGEGGMLAKQRGACNMGVARFGEVGG